MKRQSEIFEAAEGDAWHRRNAHNMDPSHQRATTSILLDALLPFSPSINHIVEVGCGNGSELQKLCTMLHATGTGIEPSQIAVDDGNRRAGNDGVELTLMRGNAASLPCENDSADVLFFGFCLYLVDRQDLFLALAEAHRVLRPGGFLAILDFDPAQPHRRQYAHHHGIFSYKQDYSEILLATHMYSLVSKTSFSHSGDGFEISPDDRVALSLMYKETQAYQDWQAPNSSRSRK